MSKYSLAFILFLCVMNTVYSSPYRGTPGAAKMASTSLKESILFAFNHDPSISQQAAQMGIGNAQIDEARSGWMPQLSLNGNVGRNKTTDSSGSLSQSAAWGLSVTQLVYDFGKTNNTISESEAKRDSYRYQLMATLSDVAEETALDYIDVQRYHALVQAARDNIVALESVQHMAKLRAEAGLSSTSDELQTETRIAALHASVAQYESALNSARAKLAVVTGIDANKLEPLPDSLREDQNSLENIDYTHIPSVLAARLAEKSAQYAVEVAKAQHLPTLSLQGGRTRYESNNRSYWDDQIQLNVDAPIYQGGAVTARVHLAEGNRDIASSMVEQARFDALQKATVAMADWTGAQGRADAGKLQLDNADRTREVYRNEYTLSKRSINDLLSVEQDVWQAASTKISAEYDCWSAVITYSTAVGDLLSLIGIEKNATEKLPDLN